MFNKDNRLGAMSILRLKKSNWVLSLIPFILLVVMGMYGVVHASVMPDFVRLSPITDKINKPISVALDQNGRLYVGDAGRNKVVLFSQSGQYIHTISGLAVPISIAVDNNDRIYIGNKDKGNVEVYDSSYNLLYKLGTDSKHPKGDNVFKHPNDIAISTSGDVYVVDKGADVVQVYDPAGTNIATIGSSGNGDGQFHKPVSIAIDELEGEIIVLDRQKVNGQSLEGARVQFFDMNGTYKRSFSRYGNMIGDMARPQRLTVDSASRLYVTDSMQNVVLVYDNVGTYLGAVFDVVNPLRTPVGITISETNQLYVASRLKNRVEVYGIDEYTMMNVDPVSLTFEAVESGDNPVSQTVSVINNGRTVISWASVANDSWISLSETGGVADLGQTVTLDAAGDIGGLAAGEHKGSFSISAGVSATETVNVTLNIEPSPILSVAPAALTMTAETGSSASEGITIANSGSAALIWNVSADQPWISFNKGSGTIANSGAAPEEVTVLADASALGVGTYTGTITVTGEEALASPATIEVTLTLTEPPVVEPAGPPTAADRVIGDMVWTPQEVIPGISFNDVWGSSVSDIYVVGDKGTILHYDGTKWSPMDSSTRNHLLSVWGSSDTDVYAVGKKGTILHYDGSEWSSIESPAKKHLHSVWGSSAVDVYAVGDKGLIVHYDGPDWSIVKPRTTEKHLYGVWGISSEAFAVGSKGAILNYDSSGWGTVKPLPTKKHLYGIWGSSASDVYAVGEDGTMLRYDGTGWNESGYVTDEHVYGIWGSSATDVFAVGDNGTLLYNDGNGFQLINSGLVDRLNGVWGSSVTTDIFAVGANGVIFHGKNE